VDNERPNPDTLLRWLQTGETQEARGRLKIFLGMAAGVGKTYEMLTQAHRLKADGIDVVVGIIETHGRKDTAALLDGLEIIPRRSQTYRGVTLSELDVDAIVARKPKVVLIDELAHTNAPESRHQKRYQDVEEILNAGIDVFSTLNVQHLESRKDTVEQMTGISIRETIPDSIIDRADEVELIDLPPDVLIERLEQGKVYVSDNIEPARSNFFQKGNITALREIALRLTAEKVDQDLQDFSRERGILRPLKTNEKLLVALGPNPSAERLVRLTRKLAYNLEANWIAVFIETENTLNTEELEAVRNAMDLAKALGAEVITTRSPDIAEAILRVSKENQVTQIILGRPKPSIWSWINFDRKLLDSLLSRAGSIDLHLVETNEQVRPIRLFKPRRVFQSSLQSYALALGTTAFAVLMCLTFQNDLEYSAIGLILLLNAIVQGLYVGQGPLMLSATVTAALWNFLFIPPRYTFFISRLEDVLLFIIFVVGAFVMGSLIRRVRAREITYRNREAQAQTLLDLSEKLAESSNMEHLVKNVSQVVGRTFTTDVAISIVDELNSDNIRNLPWCVWQLDSKDQSLAQWAFSKKIKTGRFTETLRDANGLHLPLITRGKCVGILSLRPRRSRILIANEMQLLDAFASYLAVAIERLLLQESALQNKELEISLQLEKSLVNSVSHELRTPITTISGNISALEDSKILESSTHKTQLLDDMKLALARLNQVVSNLLDVSRLESGVVRAKAQWTDLNDIFSSCRKDLHLFIDLVPSRINIEESKSQILLLVDEALFRQALINVLHNALKYSPISKPVEVKMILQNENLILQILDHGSGVSPESLSIIFDRFKRLEPGKTGGVGLGLPIAKGFLEAQGLSIQAANDPGSGLLVTIAFPPAYYKILPV